MHGHDAGTADLYVTLFGAALERAGKAPNTFKRYAVFLRQFSAWLGDRDVAAVGAAEIADEYLAEWWVAYKARYGRAPSDNTVRNHHTALGSFYEFLFARDLVSINPMRKLARERPAGKKKRNDFLTVEEDAALIAAASTPEERIIASLLRYSGMRAAEASALLWRDVTITPTDDYPYGTIRVLESKTVAGERVIPVFPELQLELYRWWAYQELRGLTTTLHPVLSSKHGRPMTHDFLWRIVKRVAFKAGVRPRPCTCGTTADTRHDASCPRTKNGHHRSEVTPHTLRRTFGTSLRRQGKSLDLISKLLGHSSTKVTEEFYVELEEAVLGRELFDRPRLPATPVRQPAESAQAASAPTTTARDLWLPGRAA